MHLYCTFVGFSLLPPFCTHHACNVTCTYTFSGFFLSTSFVRVDVTQAASRRWQGPTKQPSPKRENQKDSTAAHDPRRQVDLHDTEAPPQIFFVDGVWQPLHISIGGGCLPLQCTCTSNMYFMYIHCSSWAGVLKCLASHLPNMIDFHGAISVFHHLSIISLHSPDTKGPTGTGAKCVTEIPSSLCGSCCGFCATCLSSWSGGGILFGVVT